MQEGDGELHVEVGDAPRSLLGIMRQLGPGIIMAGCIVGSGELIATTSTGGKAGFSLLWIIVIGCFVKFWVQVELGKHAIYSRMSSLEAMDKIPALRVPLCKDRSLSVLSLQFCIFIICTLPLLSAILSGVGQTLEIALPFTSQGRSYNEFTQFETLWRVKAIEDDRKCKDNLKEFYADMIAHDTRFYDQLSASDQAKAADRAEKSFQNTFSDLVSGHGNDDSFWKAEMRNDRKRAIEHTVNPCKPNMTDYMAHERARVESPMDSVIWSAIVVAVSIPVFLSGKYLLVEIISSVLLGIFSLLCVVSLVLIQAHPAWHVSWAQFASGLTFQVPSEDPSESLSLSMSAFGLIGAGAVELVSYSYWALEKGYAKKVGPNPALQSKHQKFTLSVIDEENMKATAENITEDDQKAWNKRAEGWIRIMKLDLVFSTVAFTFTTIIFYILGAAVLHQTGLEPKGTEMIRYLATMFEPPFGKFAVALFLVGSFAILFSSFFLSTLIFSRLIADFCINFGVLKIAHIHIAKRVFCVLYPLVLLGLISFTKKDPKAFVDLVGALATIQLPIVAFVALQFRFVQCPQSLKSGKLWDALLILSAVILTATSGFTIYIKFIA